MTLRAAYPRYRLVRSRKALVDTGTFKCSPGEQIWGVENVTSQPDSGCKWTTGASTLQTCPVANVITRKLLNQKAVRNGDLGYSNYKTLNSPGEQLFSSPGPLLTTEVESLGGFSP